MRILFLITAVLIVHGSLYPWHFHDSPGGFGPFWILIHSWPYQLDRYLIRDAFLNVAVYVPLGLTASLSIDERRPTWWRVLLPLGFGMLLSMSIEMAQIYDHTRTCSAIDVVTNAIGTVLGIAIASLIPRQAEREWLRHVGRRLDALFLVILWVVWDLFPFFPQLRRVAMAEKLIALGPFHLSAPDTVITAAMWLVIAASFEVLAGRRAAILIAALLPLVPLKVAIHGRTTTWSELVGCVAGAALWLTFRGWRRRMVAVAAGAILAVVLLELAPYQWTAKPAGFVWMPFAGALEGDNVSALLILIYKTFFYAAAVWSIWQAGARLSIAAGGTAVLLLVLETLQRYLPERVPETTDAFLAILSGVVFYTAHRYTRSNRERNSHSA